MDPAMASIIMFAADFSPKYWAYCNGALLQINQNQALFSLLGTTYGGNGITTFGLPDLRGRTPVGTGSGPGLSTISLGEVSGVNTLTLTTSQMPSHTHLATLSVGATSGNANTEEPAGAIPAAGTNYFRPDGAGIGGLGGVSATVAATGGSQPFNIKQPYIGIHFIICIQGIFPSRD
jgi:microcystin-dependent protein